MTSYLCQKAQRATAALKLYFTPSLGFVVLSFQCWSLWSVPNLIHCYIFSYFNEGICHTQLQWSKNVFTSEEWLTSSFRGRPAWHLEKAKQKKNPGELVPTAHQDYPSSVLTFFSSWHIMTLDAFKHRLWVINTFLKFLMQIAALQFVRDQLWSSASSPSVQPLPFETSGPEHEQPSGFRSEAAVCLSEDFRLQTGDSQVRHHVLVVLRYIWCESWH